ncbi:MAG: hypothetical protein ACO3VQ_05170 [Ilumatobacteraceae bacterium]
MAFCYTSWITDRHLDEVHKWEEITEQYVETDRYDQDFIEFSQQWASENPTEPPATIHEFHDNMESYVERWHNEQIDGSI